MSKKYIKIISIIISAVLLVVVVVTGVWLCQYDYDKDWPYEIRIKPSSQVMWNISDEIPPRYPVYRAVNSPERQYIWEEILSFCGFTNTILLENGSSFSNKEWRIDVDEEGEIRCWYNNRNFDTEQIVQLTNSELELMAKDFFNLIGVEIDNYYISGYPIDPEGKYMTLNYSYILGDYEAEEWPTAISISFVEDKITDLCIRCEDITELGNVSSVSLHDIKEQIDDLSFYSSNPELAKKRTAYDLIITDIELTYARVEDKFLPFYSLVGQVYNGSFFETVTSNGFEAYDGAVTIKNNS